jgi:hypothetical protein
MKNLKCKEEWAVSSFYWYILFSLFLTFTIILCYYHFQIACYNQKKGKNLQQTKTSKQIIKMHY